MYLDHWYLERSPFEARPDSRFLFATEQHEQALAAISYAACEGGEPVLLRGRAGCGKTLGADRDQSRSAPIREAEADPALVIQ